MGKQVFCVYAGLLCLARASHFFWATSAAASPASAVRTRARNLLVGLGMLGGLLLGQVNPVTASDGMLDPTFGTGGRVLVDFGGGNDRATALAIDENGRIVTGGYSDAAGTNSYVMARYSLDGSLDQTFGTGGKVRADYGGGKLAIDASGRIVVEGYGLLARYNPNGTIDQTFGSGGKVVADFNLLALALDASGRIVVGGSSGSSGNFTLARYSPDGTLDQTFGTGGKVNTRFGAFVAQITSVAIDSSGRIVAGGYSYSEYADYDGDFALARYVPDGTLDLTFGTGGKVRTDFPGLDDAINALAIDASGRIVAAGQSDESFALARYNLDGTLDQTFGTGGKVLTDFGRLVRALSIDAGARIVAAGSSKNRDFALARYNTDGTLDPTFGASGKVLTDHGGTDDEAVALAIDEGGRFFAGGFSNFSGTYDFAVARYHPDGAIDPDFGTGGKVFTDFGSGEWATALAIDANGRTIAGGYSSATVSTYDFVLARYHLDGSLDPVFGTGGKVLTEIRSDGYPGSDQATALAIDASGRIVAAGGSGGDPQDFQDFALARYNPDGTLDPTFGTGGKVLTDFFQDDLATAVAIDASGRIIAAGHTNDVASGGGSYDFALTRYNPDGTLDPSFGALGKVTTDFGSSSGDLARALAIDGSGRIVVGGSSNAGGTPTDFALARYNTDGTLDQTFGAGGKVLTDFGIGDRVAALRIDASGRIVVGGSSRAGGTLDFALARYNLDGTLDQTFGTDGKVLTDLGGTDDQLAALAIDVSGRIIVGGHSNAAGAYDFALARYNADGTFDQMFGTGGKATTDFGSRDRATALAIDARGRIVVAGSSNAGGTNDFALARYITDFPTSAMGLDFTPNTLNLASQGLWMTGFLEPVSLFAANTIDAASIRLNGTVPVDPAAPTTLGDHDGNGVPDLMVKFNRVAVELTVPEGDNVPVNVTGTVDGQAFSGTEYIRVRRAVVSAPAAGSHLMAGATTAVRWETPSEVTVSTVALLQSLDGGTTWSLIAHGQPNTWSYEWTVANVQTDHAKVAVVLVESADETGLMVDGVLGVSAAFSIDAAVGVGDPGPASPALAIRGATPTPAVGGRLQVEFTLGGQGPAKLELIDIAGRVVRAVEVGWLGPGAHNFDLAGHSPLRPGIYFLRLRQGGNEVRARVAVVD